MQRPSSALLAGLGARGIDYSSRLRTNAVLNRLAEPHMVRPVGRRPVQPRTCPPTITRSRSDPPIDDVKERGTAKSRKQRSVQ